MANALVLSANRMIFDGKIKHQNFLQVKIDHEIGYNYWKKYVAAAFWCQVSTPINLTLTFLAAITTAQANTRELISDSIFEKITIVTLVITTLNTFFRPHTQYSQNTAMLQKWNDVGIKFEKEYYKKTYVRFFSDDELRSIETKIKSYEDIQDDVHAIRKGEGGGAINFLTDLIFLLSYSTCIRKYKRWLDMDNAIHAEVERTPK